ncbi:MAG: biopolymer transporter ExbD [Candidatus Gastranaerophilales bacterium]|jgi:biopolymer transport protein ExbD/biopolymer transport protein TolR|nr:biopolymer transporter ExbD [Candidatus Gastranaerophilales bacterium]
MAFNGKKGQIFSEINITPLTDIFLVLLIIMMFVAPMFQSANKNIEVPEINSGVSIQEDAQNITLSISKDGHYYINSTEINPQNLTTELSAVAEKAKDKKIIVKADANVKSKEIINVVKAAQDTGFEKLVVAGEPLSKKAQKQLKDMQETDEVEQNIHPTSNVILPKETNDSEIQTEYKRPNFDFEE